MSKRLREVACGECGSVNEPATQLLEQVREQLALAERDLRAKRSQIAALRAEQDEAYSSRPQFADAVTVLTYWREKIMPGAREIRSGDRMGHTIARLRGAAGSKYTKEDLLVCVDGYAKFPYVTRRGRAGSGLPAEWRADAELIFRSPRHVDDGMRLAKEQVYYAPEALSFVPWQSARLANRVVIYEWLAAHGDRMAVLPNEVVAYACPFDDCEGHMHVNGVESSGRVALCTTCNRDETTLLVHVQKNPVKAEGT